MNDLAQPIEQKAAQDGILRDCWYFALPGRALKPGGMVHKVLLGEPVLLARGADGAVFALRDICPHRGVPLSKGTFDGAEVECPYHGWRFDGTGRCTAIPSLVEGQGDIDPGRIKVRRYPAREVQGNIWVYFAEDGRRVAEDADLPEVPRVPGAEQAYQFHVSMIFPCAIDHAVIGLMDPAHGPFVHKSPLWRSRKDIHEKSKAFSPRPMGWAMDRHAPSRNSRAYKILGGEMSTEIGFQLPSIRIEHVVAGRYTMCGLTACTPLGPDSTEVNHVVYCDVPWFAPLRPVLKQVARHFLGQDGRAVAVQQEGLKYDPPLMLINDSDVMAKWYFRLKKEYLASRSENRPFQNPVKPCTLRWRS
jgi:phenylpropionate dioxygenase-like ring-hydroxylating dioxygenase large terminal subunit